MLDYADTSKVRVYDVEQDDKGQYQIIGDTKFSLNRNTPRLKRTFCYLDDMGHQVTKKIEIYKSELLFMGAYYLAEHLFNYYIGTERGKCRYLDIDYKFKIDTVIYNYKNTPYEKLHEMEPEIEAARQEIKGTIKQLELECPKSYIAERIEKYWDNKEMDNLNYYIKSATSKDTDSLSDIVFYKKYSSFKVRFSGTYKDLVLTDNKAFRYTFHRELASDDKIQKLEMYLKALTPSELQSAYEQNKKELEEKRLEQARLEAEQARLKEEREQKEPTDEAFHNAWINYLNTGDTSQLKTMGVRFDDWGNMKHSNKAIPLDILKMMRIKEARKGRSPRSTRTFSGNGAYPESEYEKWRREEAYREELKFREREFEILKKMHEGEEYFDNLRFEDY